MTRFFLRLLEAFYRRRCLGCRAWNYELLCQPCWGGREVAPQNIRVFGVDSVRAFLAYRGVGKKLVGALKYDGEQEALKWFLAADHEGGSWFSQNCLLVPVPLHCHRMKSRGHNQALSLAQAISNKYRLNCADVLRRVRPTPPLFALSRRARNQVMKGAIRSTRSLVGIPVVLVDDVVTTGATAQECARAVREAGAVSVTLLAATATPSRDSTW